MQKQAIVETAQGDSDAISATEAAMQALVDGILNRLRDADIPHCLLRNRDRIPSGLLGWTDLDLMVSADVPLRRLITLLADLNPTLIAPIRDGFTALFFPANGHFLRVDLFNGDIEWRAAVYGENAEIVEGRWNDDGIMVASEMHQAFLAWFSTLIRNGAFSKRYAPLITRLIREQPAAFQELLQRTFGANLADELVLLAQGGRMEESEALASACRRAVWLGALRRHPLRTMGRFGKQLGNAIEHRLRPSGLDVALLGPDGAGKTTLCTMISELPSRKVPFGNAHYRKLYHRVLPPLGAIESALLRRPRRPQPDPMNPHGMSPRHPLVWLFSYGYYTVDHWLSEIIWNRQKLAHINLMLHDRHPLEVVIDPRRYRYTGPLFLARWIGRLAPKPDLVVVLDAPPEVIQARKQDVTFEETVRQRAAYRALAESLPNGRIVDATQPLDKVISDVISHITAFTELRTKRRFNLSDDGVSAVTAPELPPRMGATTHATGSGTRAT